VRKYWFRIVVSLWLAVLTVGMIVLYNRMEIIPEVLSEQDRQAGILLKQSEILAVNTVLIRFLTEKAKLDKAESVSEVSLRLEEMAQ
jgi:hypothetical protein